MHKHLIKTGRIWIENGNMLQRPKTIPKDRTSFTSTIENTIGHVGSLWFIAHDSNDLEKNSLGLLKCFFFF